MSNYNEYDIGDSVRPRVEFKVGTTPTDPTTITLTVTDPTGVPDVYTYGAAQITRESAGVYYKDITVDDEGEWHYRFVGGGSVVAVGQSRFVVRRTGA